MKTPIRAKKFLSLAVALGMVASICTSWGAIPAQALIIIGTKTGLFGVTQGQKVRISTVNVDHNRGGIAPCVGIFGLAGNELARNEGMPLMRGQGTFFDFDASMLGLRAGERAQLRVEVELEPTPDADGRTRRIQPDEVIVTVEVYDNASGKTMFVIPATLKGFNPQPEPPLE